MNLQTALFDPDLRGRTPLWQVFWIEGVLVSHALFAAILMAYARVSTSMLLMSLLGFLMYTGFILRRVWINSDNTRKPIHGDAARFLTVAWALNAVLFSVFMALGHAAGEPLSLPFN